MNKSFQLTFCDYSIQIIQNLNIILTLQQIHNVPPQNQYGT